MKTTILLIFIFTYFTINLHSQWQQDVRLTIDPGASITSLNNNKCIASNGDTIHIVWYDNRDGDEEIYYKRSTDNGTNWGLDVRLTNSIGLSNYPVIFASGPNIRVAWRDSRDGNYEEYYKRSTDGGTTWSVDVRLTNAQFTSSIPSILVSGLNEYLVWHDYRDDPSNIVPEIYFKKSTDGGISWLPEVRLTDAPNSRENPTIALSNSIIHVAWADTRMFGAPEIFYKRSTDNGTNWSADTQLSNNPTSLVSNNPCITAFGSYLHVTWNDNRNYDYEIYYKRSTDNGSSWESDTRLTNSSGASYNSSLISNGSLVQFVWYDYRSGSFQIYYKRSIDNGSSWEPDLQLTTDINGASSRPSMCASGSQLNVMWCDLRDGNSEIYYKRNPLGNVVGVNYTNSGLPVQFSLSQNCPNPFNPTTNFEFRIADFGLVNLTIYDAMGRTVETLQNGEMKPGVYKAEWNASGYPSGVYFYKLSTGSFTETKKMVLVK